MEKIEYNPGPRLSEKEIERLVEDMYADGKSPMESFGIDWAATVDLSVKLEAEGGKVKSVEPLARADGLADKEPQFSNVELYFQLEDGSKLKIMPCDLKGIHLYRSGDKKDADLPET